MKLRGKLLRGGWTLLWIAGLIASAAGSETSLQLASPPHWIWAREPVANEAVLSKKVALSRSIQAGQLKFAADFCQARVVINGTHVLSVQPFCQSQTLDVTAWLVRGENEIVIEGSGSGGPPAVALSLVVIHSAGEPTTLITDDTWDAADLGGVAAEHWGVGRRGIELSPFENYEQWQQAKSDAKQKVVPKFWTPPGFTVTELRAAQPQEGSWISLTFDPQGRLIVSREDEGLLRMTLNEGRTAIAKVEPIAAKVQECRGLAFEGQQLFAQANNSQTLFQLQLDDKGQFRQQKPLRHLPGKAGHGRNDITLFGKGAERRLFAICGDSVDLPRENIRDFTSPLNETKRRGPQREGFLLRGDVARGAASSGTWDLLCAGLRNPYGIAVDQAGVPFTFDADNEFDMGTPWYRPTRILQLQIGGDTGYRESTGKFPPRFHDQPDHAPPLFDIGRSSPTSVMFGYDLQAPTAYQQALYALDWTYGRVLCIHLAPRGATYRAAAELFLQGRPLNVTDIAAGPDGAMYLITGGRKTQSALYRVHFAGPLPEAPPVGKHEQATREYSQRVRDEQRALLQPTLSPEELTTRIPRKRQLTTDPVLRHATRIALERQPLAHLRGEALDGREPNLFRLLALARARHEPDVLPMLRQLHQLPFDKLDLTGKFVWLRIVGLCQETAPAEIARQAAGLKKPLCDWWQKDRSDSSSRSVLAVAPEGTSVELRRRVALLLGDLSAEELPALVAADLFTSSVQEDQLAGLLATRSLKAGWTETTRRAQFAALNEIPRMIGGAGLPPFEKWLRPQIVQTLSPQEQIALKDVIEPRPATSEPLPPPRRHVQKWSLEELASLHVPDAPAGDAKRGAIIFQNALCSRCHRVGARGAAVGPDLTHVSRRFSRRDLLESIVSPSLSVAENFRLETILAADGRVITGRVLSEGDYRSEKLILATDPLRPELTVEIDKKDISEHRATLTSPMPAGLLDTFSLGEIRDLLAYLEAGR
jgi:putative heme-binding domain-containing protein